jgi:hypothetical protein
MEDVMQNIFITDESIVTTLRNAGYTCELNNTDVVYLNPPSWLQNVPVGDWYTTDCPLDPHNPVAGIVLFGTFAIKAEQREQMLEQAKAARRIWLASFGGG